MPPEAQSRLFRLLDLRSETRPPAAEVARGYLRLSLRRVTRQGGGSKAEYLVADEPPGLRELGFHPLPRGMRLLTTYGTTASPGGTEGPPPQYACFLLRNPEGRGEQVNLLLPWICVYPEGKGVPNPGVAAAPG
jgi:hypothetical protein